MKVMFWNLMRLGATTTDVRKEAIEYMTKNRLAPDLALFCELLAGATDIPAQNVSYRKENPYQLCYGAMDGAGNSVDLVRYAPDANDDYKAAGFSGGNNFKQLCDRAPAHVGKFAGVDLYVIHAPANHEAALKVMSFLVAGLVKHHGANPWMVIGDLNVPPEVLQDSPVKPGGNDMGDYILESGARTHWSKRTDRTLDYAVCNFVDQAEIASIWVSPRRNPSDHIPIVVTW